MRAFVIIAALCLSVLTTTAGADENWEVLADSTIDGNAGFVVKINDVGFETVSLFLFQEGGLIRVYAIRDGGSSLWNIQPGSQYIVPAATMNINDNWRFLDGDLGNQRTATVVAQESIGTSAGTFLCYRVEVEDVTNPGVVVQVFWFSDGVGIIRQLDYVPGTTQIDWQIDLASRFLAGGSGFLPLSTGNTWQYTEIASPVETKSWGAVKSLYSR